MEVKMRRGGGGGGGLMSRVGIELETFLRD